MTEKKPNPKLDENQQASNLPPAAPAAGEPVLSVGLLQASTPFDAAAVADVVRRHIEPRTIEVSDGERKCQVLLLPKSDNDGNVCITPHAVKPFLDLYATAPERREGKAVLTELDSFIAHVERFKDEDSVIFAHRDPKAPHLLAVLDYHEKGSDGAPRYGKHRSVYHFPISDEWAAWSAKNGQWMGQADFAEFLENRIADVADPLEALETTKGVIEAMRCQAASPATLIDLARSMTVRVNSVVANAQNLASGESQIRYETSHQDASGAPLNVPGAFIICMPVFRSGAAYQIGARLRYRLAKQEAKIVWSFDLYRMAETFDHAFKEACERAATETELPLLFGSPEA
ncbi:MAG TPA: DUF2303 family protein [Polyangiaceae bacterium]|jgi:uncharacterized protein YfdQ (DUF2303 family)